LARTRKKHAQRRLELVKTAWELFSTQGYEETTVQAIIDRSGISKGTFYHYFSSKEDVLDAIIQWLNQEGLARIRPVLDDPSLPALDKLSQFLARSRAWRLENLDKLMTMARAFLSQENVLLRYKMRAMTEALVAPLLAGVITQGLEEGVFDTPDPVEAAKTVIHLGQRMAEDNLRLLMESLEEPWVLNRLDSRIGFYTDLLERILGAPKGSLKPSQKGSIQALAQTLGLDGEQALS